MSEPAEGLPPGLALTDSSTLGLGPTLISGRGDRFVVVDRFTRRGIVTGQAGVRAINLLREGRTLGEMKAVLAQEHRCAPEEIDIGPLLAALWSAGLVRVVDGRTVAGGAPPRRAGPALYFVLFILSPLLSLALRCVPLRLALWLAHRVFATRQAALERRIADSLQITDLGLTARERHRTAVDNSRNVRKQFVDRGVLASLSPERAAGWLARAARITGLAHLERSVASGRGTILCGYHMGSYGLLPFILGANGVPLTVLGGFGEQDQTTAARVTAALSESGVMLPVRVVSGKWALRAVASALAKGETVLLYCDRATDPARALRVPFLGTAAYATTGVARLRERTGAAILPTVLLWDGDQRHHLIIEPEVTLDPSADPTTRVRAVTAEVYRVLERYVRRYPAHWLKWKDFRDMTCDDSPPAARAELAPLPPRDQARLHPRESAEQHNVARGRP